MDELDAFERQVADELALMAGRVALVDPVFLAQEVILRAPRPERSRRPKRLLAAAVVVGVIVAFVAIGLAIGGLGGDPPRDDGTLPRPFASFAPLLEPTATPRELPVPPPPDPPGAAS